MLSRAQLAAHVDAEEGPVDLIHMDLDHFHLVNTRWGQEVGDRLLAIVERRLLGRIPSSALLARTGGDAFAVVVADADPTVARSLADDLLAVVAEPASIDGRTVTVRATAALARRDSDGTLDLIESAIAACRRAKAHRRGEVVDAHEEVEGARALAELEGQLARAVRDEEFRLHYQPEVDLGSGEVVGVEALLRWQHPEHGLLGPDRFLAVAEDSGLIGPIGEWVVAEAISQAAAWERVLPAPVRIWVNLSAVQLGDIGRIRQLLISQIQLGFDPRWLGFEVTESGFLRELDRAVQVLSELRALGVEIALDDFGTGYSSLAYLRQLPVGAVKIDRSFVSGVGGSLADTVIVDAVTDLAHALGLVVIAEGVEDRGQLEALQAAGVDRGQGFWLSEPVSADRVTDVLQAWCGRPDIPTRPARSGTKEDRRAQVMFAALDALTTPAVVTGVPAPGSLNLPTVVSANAAFRARLGFSADPLRPPDLNVLIDHATDPSTCARWRAALSSGQPSSVRVACRDSAGLGELWDVEVRPFDDASGKPVYRLQTMRPAVGSDALQTEALVALLDRSSEAMAIVSRDGVIQWSNHLGAQLTGRLRGSSFGTFLFDWVHPDDEVAVTAWFGAAMAGELPPSCRARVANAGDGAGHRWFELVAAITDVRIDGFIITARDVHHQVLAEQEQQRWARLDDLAYETSRRALSQHASEFLDELEALIASLAEALDADVVTIEAVIAAVAAGEAGITADLGPIGLGAAGRRTVRRVAETVAGVMARDEAERAQRRSQDRLDAVLDASAELIGVIDRDAFIRFLNDRAERYFGLSAEAVDGTSMAAFVHPDDLEAVVHAVATAVERSEVSTAEVRMRGAGGDYRWFEITNGVTLDPDLQGVVVTARDITDRKAQTDREARHVANLEFGLEVAQRALDLAPAAFLESLPTVVERAAALLASDRLYITEIDELAGVTHTLAAFGDYSGHGLHLHDLGDTPLTQVARWYRRLTRLDPVVIADTTHVAPPEVEAASAGAAVLIVPVSVGGRLVAAVGAGMDTVAREWTEDDITVLKMLGETVANLLERRRLDEALASSEGRFRLLSEASVDVIGLCDVDGLVQYVSPSMRLVLGYEPAEVLGRGTLNLLRRDDARRLPDILRRVDDSGWHAFETEVRHADGSYIWAGVTLSVAEADDGGARQYRFSLRDISDLKRLQNELQRRALHDPLTGLANRVLLQNRLELELAHREARHDLSVLLIDLDGFKEVNDTRGHAVGDDVLRLMAARLNSVIRPTDTLARFGGDEFVLLCPEITPQEAEAVAERIVVTASRPVPIGSAPIVLGASVGVALCCGSRDAARLLIEADRAMYESKRAGKGRVRLVAVGPNSVG